MATGPQIVTFPLDLGMRNTAEYQPQPFGQNPALVKSRNTRLGVIGGLPSKAPAVAAFGTTGGDERRAGIVPSGLGSSLIVAAKSNERFTSGGHELVPAVGNTYFSYEVESHGIVQGARSFTPPSTCVDSNGNTWFASLRYSPVNGGTYGIVVQVQTPTGEVGATPHFLVSPTSATAYFWVGITPIGGAGKVVVWWRSGANQIRAQRLLFDPASLQVVNDSAATNIYAPVSTPSGSVAVHSDHHSQYAWLVSRGAAATTIIVNRVDMTNLGAALTSFSAGLGSNVDFVSVRHLQNAGSQYVAVAVSTNTGATFGYLVNGATMAMTYGVGLTVGIGPTACTFSKGVTTGVFDAVFATSTSVGGLALGSFVAIERYSVPGSVSGGVVKLPWKGIVSNGAWDRDAAGNIAPLIALQNCYDAANSSVPTNAAFVSDPAVEIWRGGYYLSTAFTMVARFAVDTALIYPGVQYPGGSTNGWLVQNPGNLDSSQNGSSIVLTYLEDTSLSSAKSAGMPGFSARFVAMSSGTKPPAYTIDSAGLAIVGSGPASWDGYLVSEWAPTQAPKVVAAATGGTAAWATGGTFRISAMHQWKDATGQLHRSAPAPVVTLVVTPGQTPKISVTQLASANNWSNQDGYETTLYISQPGATALFAQQAIPTAYTAVAPHMVEFSAVAQPRQDAMTPAIPTDATAGFPLPAQCPPFFQAVAIVGERMWGLSLGELWYSKPKEPGIAFEFSSEQRFPVPAAAGKAFDLHELRGSLVMLAERGAWVVTGQGPDSALGGAGFNPPEQISDLPCTDRLSVVRTPAGIFFRSGSRFATLGGELGTGLLDDFECTSDVSYRAINLPDTKEVVWFFANVTGLIGQPSEHVVFNYDLRRFTCWDASVVAAVASACVDPVTGLVSFVTAAQTLARMDPASIGNAPMFFSTGDVRLGGEMEEADCALQHVLISGQFRSAHSVDVDLYQDFASVQDRTESYSSSAIQNASNSANGSQRYTLQVEAKGGGAMRAIYVDVTFTGNGDCVRAYAITLVYSQKSGTKSDAVFQSAKR